MAPKSSPVWSFFEILSKDKAQCDFCRAILSYKGSSTSNLKKHLSRHPGLLTEVENNQKKKQNNETSSVICLDDELQSNSAQALTSPAPDTENVLEQPSNVEQQSNVARSPQRTIQPVSELPTLRRTAQPRLDGFFARPISSQKKRSNDLLLLKMIARDLQPFTIVEDLGFREFVAGLAPTYKLPSRTTLSRQYLQSKFSSVETAVQRNLESVDFVCLTTDIWTSRTTKAYISVTAHFISDDWTLNTILLGCLAITGSHTAGHIRDELVKVCRKWNLSSTKVTAIVTDNGANMVAAVRAMPVDPWVEEATMDEALQQAVRLLGWTHLRCLAHTINLVVQDGIKVIEPIRSKVRSIVGYFHRSTRGADKLEDTQARDNPGKTPLKLINEVSTRWNSTYFMLERVCAVRNSLVSTIAVLAEQEIEPLTETDFDVMRQTVELLKPFEEVSTELCAEKNVSASKVIVLLGALKKRLGIMASSTTGDIQIMADRMLKNIRDRYPMLEGQQVLQMPTFLDPRFKKFGFDNQTRYQECRLKVQNAVADLIRVDGEETQMDPTDLHPAPVTSSLYAELNSRKCNSNATPTCSGTIEVRQYVEDAAISINDDPLLYWKNKAVVFPRLAKLAKKYLSVVATSVPSERVFSTAGQLISDRRSRLLPENVEKIMFLNGNINYYNA